MPRFTPEELEEARQQIQEERASRSRFAFEAARKLSELTNLQFQVYTQFFDFFSGRSYGELVDPIEYKFSAELSQYDNWGITIARLSSLGIAMDPWDGMYGNSPTGVFDLTSDPLFAGPQKVFRITLQYYDSHSCGF